MSVPENMNFPNVSDPAQCPVRPERLWGHGPPAGNLGQPGDTYVDVDANSLWWKSANQWNPDGASSVVIEFAGHGHGPPDPAAGAVGDTYVDDDAGALYWKALDGWHP